VAVSTILSVALLGYWAFGNQSAGNIFNNFAPTGEPSLVPNWLLFKIAPLMGNFTTSL